MQNYSDGVALIKALPLSDLQAKLEGKMSPLLSN